MLRYQRNRFFARTVHGARSLFMPVFVVAAILACSGKTGEAAISPPGFFSSLDNLSPAGKANHTATLLQNGRILVYGGFSQYSTATNSVELYEPSTGRFKNITSATIGSLPASGRHTATVLQNGKILLVGGRSDATTNNTLRIFDPSDNSVTSGPPLTTARYDHTATRLTDGTVLICGGMTTAGTATNTCQLYNPAANTLSAEFFMGVDITAIARAGHTATLLPDGRVLIAGGYMDAGKTTSTTSATAYTPATTAGQPGTFAATGILFELYGRFYHSATLLANGKVLLTGGKSGIGGPPAYTVISAELFDPTANGGVGAFSSNGFATGQTLTASRYGHTATLMPDGTVLITGGVINASSAESYDPVSSMFTPISSSAMVDSVRIGHTATLLTGGNVLVIGGADSSGTAKMSAEIYVPAPAGSTPTASLVSPRAGHTATLLNNGTVLIAGGRGNGTTVLDSTEVYTPAHPPAGATFGNMSSHMSTPRQYHTATQLMDGRVLIAGGESASGAVVNTADLFDPITGTFTSTTGNMVFARARHMATLLPDGRVLLSGSSLSGGDTGLEIYDPVSGTFTAVTNGTMTGRSRHTATLLTTGKVLIAGGNDGTAAISAPQLFDPITGTLTAAGMVQPMQSTRQDFSATLLPDGRVLLAGGVDGNGSRLSSAEIYDPVADTFTPVPGTMSSARTSHTATLLPDGRVLIAGGYDVIWPNASIDIYDPAIGAFISPAGMTAGLGRVEHTATLLPDGTVLLVGGYGGNSDFSPPSYIDSGSAETYQPGTVSDPTRKPAVGSPGISSSGAYGVNAGGVTSTVGATFSGASEASSGGTNSSPGNYPLLQLVRLDNQQSVFVLPDTDPNQYPPWYSYFVSSYWINSFSSASVASLPDGPYMVRVFVNGVASDASPIVLGPSLSANLEIPQIDFGSQQVGTTSLSQSFTIRNNGSRATVLKPIQILRPDNTPSPEFSLSGGTTCAPATALAVGATCTVEMTFTPNGVNGRTAALVVAGDTAISFKVALSGTGVAPGPSNGACGPSNGGIFGVAPTTGLCNAGSPSAITGTGPWSWTCHGANGGTDAVCSASFQTLPAPITSVDPPPFYFNGTSLPLSGKVTDLGTGVSKVEVQFDGTGPWYAATLNVTPLPPYTWTYTWASLPEGPHTVTARATDNALTIGPVSSSVSVVVDRTPPTITGFNLPATSSSLTVGFLPFSAADSLSGVVGYAVTETATPPVPPSLVSAVTASRFFVLADNTDTATITAMFAGVAIPDGTPVSFAVVSGTATLSALTAPTSNNAASVTVKSTTAGSAVITASVNGIMVGSTFVNFTTDSVVANGMTLTASPASLLADNSSAATLTATFATPVADGTPVDFSVISGNATLSTSLAYTSNNVATVTVKSGTVGAATIIASSAVTSVSTTVIFNPTTSILSPVWQISPPTSYTFSSGGAKTAYAWAVDAAGNVSSPVSASVTITATPGGPYSYTGRVTDASTNQPLAGASVTTMGLSPAFNATTDANGMFTIAGIPANTSFALRINKAGANYADTYSANLVLNANMDDSGHPWTLFTPSAVTVWGNLTGNGVIRSRVVDTADVVNGFIGGAVVTAIDAATSLVYPVLYYDGTSYSTSGTTSINNGVYLILNMPPGATVNVTASKNGYVFQSRTYTVAADAVSEGRISGNPTTPAGTIYYTGSVVDAAAGSALSGVTVGVVGSTAITTTTLPDGSFTLTGIPSSTPFALKFSKTGYADSYSASQNSTTGIVTSGRPYGMFTLSQLAAWGVSSGNGVIHSRVVDNANPSTGHVGGAVVTAVNTANPSISYPVVYSPDGTTAGGTSTAAANGLFAVLNVPGNTQVTVTATAAGWSFSPKTYTVYADSVSQGRIYGTAAPPTPGLSGTVSYSGSQAIRRVYITVDTPNGTLGTSIGTPGPFTIHGVPPGDYMVRAFMDSKNLGAQVQTSPAGSITITMTGSTYSGATIALADQSPIAPPAPKNMGVSPGDGSALIGWDKLLANGVELADAYDIYWGTTASVTSTSATGSRPNVPAGISPVLVDGLTNGTALYFVVIPKSGGIAGTPSAVVGPITIGAPTGGNTVSGTVTYSGPTPAGPLYVAVANPQGKGAGGVYYTKIAAPSPSQSFTVSGVPNGTYAVYALFDMNNDGLFGNGDVTNTDNQAPMITLSGSDATGVAISLIGVDSLATITTDHGKFTDGTSEWYNINGTIRSQLKRPVAVTLTGTPTGSGIVVPLDIGLNGGEFNAWSGVATRPAVGDTYTFGVLYDDGTKETVQAAVAGVSDNFPATAGISGTVSTYPTFTWGAPTTAPSTGYRLAGYGLSVWNSTGGTGDLWDAGNLPVSQLSAIYGFDGRGQALQVSTPYNWSISSLDQYGNHATINSTFTPTVAGTAPDTTPPTITSASPAVTTNVPVNAVLTVTFSEAVDQTTLPNPAAVLKTGSTYVSATSSYNSATNTLTIAPSALLTPGTAYTATLSGVKDLAGNTMVGSYTIGFTTASASQVEVGADGRTITQVVYTTPAAQISIAPGTLLTDANGTPLPGPVTISSASYGSGDTLPSSVTDALNAATSDGKYLSKLAAVIDVVIGNGSTTVKKISPAMTVTLKLPSSYAVGSTVTYYSFDGTAWNQEGTAQVKADGTVDMQVSHLSLWGVMEFVQLPSGDVDGNGKVEINDALRALQIAVGLITPTASELANGDVAPLVNGRPQVNRKGSITVGDAIVVLEKVVGMVKW